MEAKLPLSERQYDCECCGMVLDRDVNAARNLAVLVTLTRAESPGVARRPETPVDGDRVRRPAEWSSTKREAGAKSRQVIGLG